jgi:MFS family permease
MISLYAASSLGQLFLSLTKEDYLFDFTIVAIFFAISIIPVCITSNIPPTNDKATIIKMKNFLQMNFAGIIGCFYAGITLATLYSILPLYFQLGGFSKYEIGVIMFAVIFGGMFFQLPIGYLSDLYNRKNMLIYLVITSILLAISMRYISSELKFYLPIAFVFGGVYFTVYPVSMSLVCDNIDKNQIVSVSQSLVLIYGIGNIIGPLIAPAFMIFLGSFGLFVFLITIGLLLITLFIKNS